MEIAVNEFGNIQLEEVFNPVVFRTETGEQLMVTMRDGGYEVSYENQKMEMKQGVVTPIVGATEHKEAAKGQLDKMTEAATGDNPLKGTHSFRYQILDMSKVNAPDFGNRMKGAGLEHHLDMAYKKPKGDAPGMKGTPMNIVLNEPWNSPLSDVFNPPKGEMIVIGNDMVGEANRIIFGFGKTEILKIGPHNIWVWGEVTESTEDVYEGLKKFVQNVQSTWPVNVSHAVEVLQKNLTGDEDYRQGWKANIAMALYDEVGNTSINGDLDLHDMCNKAADRFLDLLIKDGDAGKR